MRVKGTGIRERGSVRGGEEVWIRGAMNGTKGQSVREGDSIGEGLTQEEGAHR